jgi:NAD(P)-dependent dehydrogenase (short-subunit alcohol dehydrogenase family)
VKFTDATVLVTGATSGTGEAKALRFGRPGSSVIVSGRDRGRGERVVKAIGQAGGRARFIAADLRDSQDVLRLAGEADEADILVNNAGGSPFGGTAETGADVIRNVLDVNLVAPFLLTGQLAPKMGARRRRDRQRVPARRGARHPGPPGLRRVQGRDRPLTKAWAAEFGPAGARVNAVSPGAVRTPPAEILGEMFDQMASATPLGRAASADEVAAAITHLASDDASYITGAIPPVDAGMGAG